MKKILLLAILALSYNSFAQSNRLSFGLKVSILNSMHNSCDMMGKAGRKTADIYPRTISDQFIRHQALQGETLIQAMDSIYFWEWNEGGFAWMVIYKIIDIAYDENHNLTNETHQRWNGGNWENDVKHTATYDVNNNLMNELGVSWIDGVWQNNWLSTYTFDAGNNLTSYLYQEWGGTWINVYLSNFTYDANNNMTNRLALNWNGIDWENSWQYSLTYDESNNLTAELYQSWNGVAWENDSKMEYTYDGDNNRITDISQFWNGSAWENDSKRTYTYDDNNYLVNTLWQYWSDIDWENYELTTMTHDENHNLINEFVQSWNGNGWWNSRNHDYSYDENNNMTNELYQVWNGNGWTNVEHIVNTYGAGNFVVGESYKYFDMQNGDIINGDSIHYYYHTLVVGTVDLIDREQIITVYPNPASEQITFTIAPEYPTRIKLEVISLGGQIIATILDESFVHGERWITWNPADIPPGIYFYRLTTGNRTSTGKIVVAK